MKKALIGLVLIVGLAACGKTDPTQQRQSKITSAMKSANKGLKLAKEGEGYGCFILKASRIELIELDATEEAKLVKEGYNKFCA